jgi:hypothetical protein
VSHTLMCVRTRARKLTRRERPTSGVRSCKPTRRVPHNNSPLPMIARRTLTGAPLLPKSARWLPSNARNQCQCRHPRHRDLLRRQHLRALPLLLLCLHLQLALCHVGA